MVSELSNISASAVKDKVQSSVFQPLIIDTAFSFNIMPGIARQLQNPTGAGLPTPIYNDSSIWLGLGPLPPGLKSV
jgi:hypothetical protein